MQSLVTHHPTTFSQNHPTFLVYALFLTLTMDSSLLDSLERINRKKCVWSSPILFSVENMETGVPETIDITPRMVLPNTEMTFLYEGKYRFPTNTWCRFDRKYKGFENEKRLCNDLMRCCAKSGFKLCIRTRYDPCSDVVSLCLTLLFALFTFSFQRREEE